MEQPKISVKGGVVTYLCVEGARKAAAFYKKAFGAKERNPAAAQAIIAAL